MKRYEGESGIMLVARRVFRVYVWLCVAVILVACAWVVLGLLTQVLYDNQYDDPGGLCDPTFHEPNPGCR